MEKVAAKGLFWRIWNSLYTVMPFFGLTFVSFFYIGHKTNTIKWKLYSLLYLSAYFIYLIPGIRALAVLYPLIYIAGIAHTFITRKEYLLRLEMALAQGLEEERTRIMKNKIYEEQTGAETQSRAKEEAKPAAVISANENVKRILALAEKSTKPEVRKQLEEIALLSSKIFDYVALYPETAYRIREFTNLTLPELFAKMEKYLEYSQDVHLNLPNLRVGMKEIENFLPVVNLATRNLYNDLFADSVLEVANDIKVVKQQLDKTDALKL